MSAHFPSIAILGTGSMGGAILAGLRPAARSTFGGHARDHAHRGPAAALRAEGVEARAVEHDSDGERVGGRGCRSRACSA